LFTQKFLVAFENSQDMVYAPVSGWNQAYLLWTFRNFRSLPQNVLNPRQQQLMASLYRDASEHSLRGLSDAFVVGRIEEFDPDKLATVSTSRKDRTPALSPPRKKPADVAVLDRDQRVRAPFDLGRMTMKLGAGALVAVIAILGWRQLAAQPVSHSVATDSTSTPAATAAPLTKETSPAPRNSEAAAAAPTLVAVAIPVPPTPAPVISATDAAAKPAETTPAVPVKSQPSVIATNTAPAKVTHLKNDAAPGGDKAILTLSDGSTFVLNSTGNGTIALQGATNIVKVDNGKLAYNTLKEKPGEVTYNTLTTPAAGQFQVALPDGSKVWLSNASSLRYPVAFTGKGREVELKGEAYFEIAHNAAMPFTVKVGEKMLVNVLGTSFNIAAYGDESQVKTTLLTGAVRVSEGSANALLKPGEQVQVNSEGAFSTPKEVDADRVIAWKNGLFHFEKADVRTVMRMLARWYDVEVYYEDCHRILQGNQVHISTLKGGKPPCGAKNDFVYYHFTYS